METYLRLMYLKHRYSLGYETLVKEVSDSLSWRRFCRIALDGAVPHATTLMKLTRRFGPEIVDDLNQTLLHHAVDGKLLRSRRVRVDTTAMEADVRYPTDSGLCAHSVSRLGRLVAKVQGAGMSVRTRFRNRRRSAGKLVRQVSHALSGRATDRRAAVERLTAELHRLVQATARQANRVLTNAKQAVRRAHRQERHRRSEWLVTALQQELVRVQRIIEQTRQRLAGERSIPDRMVSLADPDARPIRRGKPQQPNEFGYKVTIADTPEGFVVAHQVHRGNPADAQTLQAAVAAAQDLGMKVGTVVADRGFGDVVGDQALAALRIWDKVIPRKGRAAAVERTRNWRRRYRWRAGCEGRISALKREYGLRRSRLKGHRGAQSWAWLGVLAHNLDRMVALS
jgi:IS5 family transposase